MHLSLSLGQDSQFGQLTTRFHIRGKTFQRTKRNYSIRLFFLFSQGDGVVQCGSARIAGKSGMERTEKMCTDRPYLFNDEMGYETDRGVRAIEGYFPGWRKLVVA